jgi:hypothetical protein
MRFAFVPSGTNLDLLSSRPSHSTLTTNLFVRQITTKRVTRMSTSRYPYPAADLSRFVGAIEFDHGVYRRKPIVKYYIANYILHNCRVRIGEQYRGPFVAKIMCVLERHPLTIYSPLVLADHAIRGDQITTNPFTQPSSFTTASGTRYPAG